MIEIEVNAGSPQESTEIYYGDYSIYFTPEGQEERLLVSDCKGLTIHYIDGTVDRIIAYKHEGGETLVFDNDGSYEVIGM